MLAALCRPCRQSHCGVRRLPYLLDCKPRSIKFVFFIFMISYDLQSRAAYIFFFCLSQCLDDAQSFLSYILLTKPSFRIILSLFSIMCTFVTRGISMGPTNGTQAEKVWEPNQKKFGKSLRTKSEKVWEKFTCNLRLQLKRSIKVPGIPLSSVIIHQIRGDENRHKLCVKSKFGAKYYDMVLTTP